jgi:succinoglycan biosynthesis transport protein ExoP
METVQYLRALSRSWYLVVVALIAGGAGGYIVYHETTPLYRSSVRMVVSGGAPGQSTDEVTARVLASQRAEALAQIASTPPAVNAAKSAAGYPSDFPSVSATADGNSPFVNVTVSDRSKTRAQAVANSFASVLPQVLQQLEGVRTTLTLTNLADAPLPGKPYTPKFKREVGLGLAAGLVLGLLLALLREIFNRSVRDSDDLAKITELTILGTVPRDMPKKLLPAVTDPRSARAEAYRQIRTTLLNVQVRNLTTVMVTSASLGEGKTSVATNLAAVFSRAGHRVALVDADLRRPRVASFYNLRSQFGLTDVLSGVVPLKQALNILDDGRLAILTSGRIPANPSEALGSLGMEQVLEQLTREYEFVIIDTPPTLPVTDASVLAPKVDGVILVARIGYATRERIRRAQGALRRVNATVLGAVPNQAGKGADRDYRYPYRYASRNRKDGAAPESVATEGLLESLPERRGPNGQPSGAPYRAPRQEPLGGRSGPGDHAAKRNGE